jgi:hypothetical protein
VPLIVRALAASSVGERLAGVAGGGDVHGLDACPIHGGEVAEVGDAGVAVGEDLAGAGVNV